MSAGAWCALKWIGFLLAFPGLLLALVGEWIGQPGSRLMYFAKDREGDARYSPRSPSSGDAGKGDGT